jgi:hypothetical protein
MLSINVFKRATKEPLMRTPAALQLDVDSELTAAVPTDRLGGARLDLPSGTGKPYPHPAVSTHRARASAERWIAPPTGACTNAVPEGAPKNGTTGRRVCYALTARAEG